MIALLAITMMAGAVSAAITYVTVTSPNGGENVSGTVNLTWDSDGKAGDPDSLTLAYSTNNGSLWKNIDTGLSCGTTSYQWDTTTTTVAGAPAASDGTNYAFAVFHSTNGSITDRSDGSFTIDNTAPTVAIDTPTDGQNVSSDTIWINGTYSDATSGVNNSSLVVKIDGTEVTGGTNTSGYYNYSATISSLSEGSHSITVDVNDYAGNTGQGTSSFTVDRSAPTFSIWTPTGNTTDSTPWINATFGDGSGTGVNASATVLIVNGTDKTASTAVNNDTDIAYKVGSALADGTIAVNISITDYMGNTTWRNWTFVVDTVAPTLALDTPADDDNVSTSTVWINGTYTDTGSGVNTSSLVVKVNGSVPTFNSMSRTSGYYNYSITLPDGDHNVTVDVNDYADNAATQELVNFTVDAEDPTFSIWTPTGNTTDSTPWINATFADDGTGVNVSATTVTVNGTDVTSSLTVNTSTNVSYHANLNDSTHTVNISITDYAGKTVWKNWTFVVDTVAPTLALDTPAENDNVSTSTVWINGTYNDTAGSGVNTSSLVVKVNGSVPTFDSASITSGYYNYSTTLSDGSHNVTVDVSDYAGNAAEQELVNFTVDTQAPDVTANPTTYPGSQSAAKTGDTVTLNATVTDDGSGVSSVTVNTSTINSTQTSVTLTQVGSTNYYNGTVVVGTSSNGTMSCAVNATDNRGHSNTSISLSVIVDNTAPSAPVVTDDGASTTSTTQLHANWTSTDSESEIVEYFYAIGNTSGGTEIVDWTSTGTTAEVIRTGLTLTAGQTYYFTVKAQNGVGDNSTAGTVMVSLCLLRQQHLMTSTLFQAGTWSQRR